jgi:potassium uptake TrkH family protein
MRDGLLRIRQPGQIVALAFAAAIAVGTALLSLPLATTTGTQAPLLTALFTATSAVCVTGLTTVDTGTYWSGFGQTVILLLIQLGGLGIMSSATLLALVFARRLGLRTRFILQTETRSLRPADMRRLILRIALFSLVVEAVLAVWLTWRFSVDLELPVVEAASQGVFHAVSAFNNAGFSLFADSLMGFASNASVLLPISAAVIIGGLGFPVVFELIRTWRRPHSWSVLTRITVTMTVILLALGTVLYLLHEGRNPATLGPLDPGATMLSAFTSSVMARTAGFNVVDIGALTDESLFTTDVLMLIGGGSAGTAGGLKVTTIGVLAFVVWAEMRGREDVEVGRRRIPTANQRAALAIVALGMTAVVVGSFALLEFTEAEFDAVVFEAVSAFATVGLSTGITPDLPAPGQVILILLMFLGRVGPLTLAAGLALRERPSHRQLPEERMIIG